MLKTPEMTFYSAQQFLSCPTPQGWIDAALANLDLLLIDHAQCEKKAAASALKLMYQYPHHYDLQQKMSRLAREELRHFEQVLDILKQRNIRYFNLSGSRYAQALHQHVRTYEPAKLIDSLIIGAFIEARSCERFAALAPLLDDQLNRYYTFLLRSESRHFQDYLQLAKSFSQDDISERIAFFRAKEAELIEMQDHEFRFHSGPLT